MKLVIDFLTILCAIAINDGSTVFNGTTLFKHKGHDSHKGKTYRINAIFSLSVLCGLRGEALSRYLRKNLNDLSSLASVFLMAVKSEAKPGMPWMVIVGAIGYPLIPYMGRFIPQQLLPSVNMPTTLYLTDPAYWRYMFLIAIQQAICAIPFRLLVGIALGFQRKNHLFVTAPGV